MGKKQISVRTLDDGYRVHHHPPTDRHPDGKQTLVPGQSRLRERLEAAHPGHRVSHAALHIRHQQAIDQRRESLHRGGVPHEKRPV